MFRRSCCGQTAADANQPAHNRTGRAGPGAATIPELARRQRCLAALIADPRPCEGGLAEVRVVERTGQGTTACRLHGAVLLASLDGARAYSLDGGNPAMVAVHNRAAVLHPFDGVWTGPGVQRVTTLAEATVFPSAPDPAESRFSSSELGNAPGGRCVPGRRYQAGHAPEGMTRDHSNGARGTRCKEVATR
jgi:hypothetical protein